MKVFISEKEIQEKELDMKQHPKHEVVITKWVVASDLGDVNDSEEYCVDIKSLEQHEEEIRKQERQKVIAELEEWVDGYDWWMQDGVIYIVRKDLRQKLKEMKGEYK